MAGVAEPQGRKNGSKRHFLRPHPLRAASGRSFGMGEAYLSRKNIRGRPADMTSPSARFGKL